MDRYALNDLSNFLDGVVDQDQQKKSTASDKWGYFEDDTGVIFRPLRCRKCGSKHIKCYRTLKGEPIIRYHFFRQCNNRFKSIEE